MQVDDVYGVNLNAKADLEAIKSNVIGKDDRERADSDALRDAI